MRSGVTSVWAAARHPTWASANSVMLSMLRRSSDRTICSTSALPRPCPWYAGSTSTSQMVALKAWSDVARAKPTDGCSASIYR